MATATKQKFSESTDGKAIKVAATSTPGTLVHTVTDDTSKIDEIWVWAYNSDTSEREVTIEFGGATAPDQNIKANIPSKGGLILVVPGLCLWGNGTPLTVKAFAAATNVITISGFINRITN